MSSFNWLPLPSHFTQHPQPSLNIKGRCRGLSACRHLTMFGMQRDKGRKGRYIEETERKTTQARKSDRGGGHDGNVRGRVVWRLLCPTLRYAWLKLWSNTGGGSVGEGGGGEGKVGQVASLICSRKASQIDLSKTMTRLLRNINPHSFNIGRYRSCLL